ncbi:MAG TPA: GNAT family protein [Anaerolineae bacterium]|nr:GNAT family protein [Anaerolineae bacterium]HPL27739.1 GNAT family protein [Anaerolineae bacterium]
MIYGQRIRLRAIERDDIPTFVRWFNDPEVRQYLLMYEPMSRAKEERWFEARLEARDDYLFAIEAQDGERWVHIGNTGLHRVDWRNRHATLGIALGEKAYWGRGYGSDAVRTMLRFAFDELNLHRVELEVFDYNRRAQRCYEKAGFRLEGTRRQALYHEGRYHDEHLMSILRGEFTGHQAQQPPQ